MKNNTPKYITKIGQNTGMSKTEKKVMTNDVAVPLKHANQNLNSGTFLVKGLNSAPSFALVGNEGPSDGSSSGERNPIKLFSKNIPSP
mmetsp:Transcript_3591/g.4747  ORF Transcript_3591/g.4747 Transcript_3591/m.4747 type:complete len:88 (-) Transcript_3591:315-578(-)